MRGEIDQSRRKSKRDDEEKEKKEDKQRGRDRERGGKIGRKSDGAKK